MKIIYSVQEWQELAVSFSTRESLGFVPTMGALHEGHMSLVQESILHNDKTIVSIFVNSTQFNNSDDFMNYPVTLEQDIKLLEDIGCDFLFLPSFLEIYPKGYNFFLSEKNFSQKLCGKNRPGHFEGVLTVVMKLFNIIKPTNAYFGKKDYQQLSLIKEMVQDFFMPINIVAVETKREESGLALSSRNMRLSMEEKKLAPMLYQVLREPTTINEKKSQLEKKNFDIEYLEQLEDRLYVAVRLGDVRLIDNCVSAVTGQSEALN